MTSAPPILPEEMNAKLSESFWDNLPYGTHWITLDFHELSTNSSCTISQQEMPTASIAKTVLSQNRAFVSHDPVYKIRMEILRAYLVGYEPWYAVEGFCQNGENIRVHGGEEFWACATSNGLRFGGLYGGSRNRPGTSLGHEGEISGVISDYGPKPPPKPQPQPSPDGDPWGYGHPLQ